MNVYISEVPTKVVTFGLSFFQDTETGSAFIESGLGKRRTRLIEYWRRLLLSCSTKYLTGQFWPEGLKELEY